MKQTAVEWLEALYYPNYIPKDIFEQAKEMEKQQIIDAYKEGVDGTKLAEQYYNEKFKNK